MKKYLICALLLLTFFYFSVAAYAAEAQNFQLMDLHDRTVSLSDYKGKQAVLLLFWTTWCPYCQEELRMLNMDRSILANKAMTLLAVNVGESKSKVKNFATERNLGLNILVDGDSRVTELYGVFGVPTYVLIDNAGQIAYEGNHFPKEKLQGLNSAKP